ncbi:hypothetical protein L9S41_12530 [Geoalkalibacter halelectricus]|uniref:Uncharacterized protein n=1 Tax=Geoalkalibacter halelectricus TaxID=2847045 RepID=A0ABY5ZMN0_9BACT|nr:hypothetical protein [Geoalkalibacter halelectricus]MDO3379684.1 hypothetical protein [Geoalkalibacter halelectricus]UWZ78501.1 hypothetical protein L9S41_12530 [Geoalkalibacter halelectricus]
MGFVSHLLLHEEFSFLRLLAQLLVNKQIIEARGGGVLAGCRENDALEPCPIGRRQTHGAGLATGIEGAALKAVRRHSATGIADGNDFGMGCRVMVRDDLVPSLADNLSVVHNDGPKRAQTTIL